jgi:trehalose 6-phosphate synthase
MNRLVVVSNRVPVPSAGRQAGGLAVALDGLMERRGGLWFGWSGAITAGQPGPVRLQHADGVDYATIDLSQEEHDRYYNNFSNGVLWPLLHTMPELMQFDRRDARTYREVNARIVSHLVPLLRPTDLVWVHDFHLMALPACLRAAGVSNPIGFFLHVPFASADVLAAAPEMAGLVGDMLQADLLGFQTDNDLANFASAATLLAGAVRVGSDTLEVATPGGIRRVRLGVFPVEIDSRSFAAMATEMADRPAAARLRASLRGPDVADQKLILGVERLDPTKGLLQRVAAMRLLLEKHEGWCRRVTLLQIAALSRKDVNSYRALRIALDRESGSLNADLGDPDWMPLRLVSRAVERPVVAGYMRMARVGLVTPLRDGMNLVAKEYVAAQDPQDPGVLVLSRFAGAARQLDAALLVNPNDPDSLADALDTALSMRLEERQERWHALWMAIEDRSPLGWGRSFVAALLRASAGSPPPRVPRPLAEVLPDMIGPRRAGAHLTLAKDRGTEMDPVRPLTAAERSRLN